MDIISPWGRRGTRRGTGVGTRRGSPTPAVFHAVRSNSTPPPSASRRSSHPPSPARDNGAAPTAAERGCSTSSRSSWRSTCPAGRCPRRSLVGGAPPSRKPASGSRHAPAGTRLHATHRRHAAHPDPCGASSPLAVVIDALRDPAASVDARLAALSPLRATGEPHSWRRVSQDPRLEPGAGHAMAAGSLAAVARIAGERGAAPAPTPTPPPSPRRSRRRRLRRRGRRLRLRRASRVPAGGHRQGPDVRRGGQRRAPLPEARAPRRRVRLRRGRGVRARRRAVRRPAALLRRRRARVRASIYPASRRLADGPGATREGRGCPSRASRGRKETPPRGPRSPPSPPSPSAPPGFNPRLARRGARRDDSGPKGPGRGGHPPGVDFAVASGTTRGTYPGSRPRRSPRA